MRAVITTTNPARKYLLIKVPHPLLFALRLLTKARCLNMTNLVLATMREYALELRVVNENESKRCGYEHTLLEQLDKFYLHLYPYPFPQYILKDKTRISTKMRTFTVYVPVLLFYEIKHIVYSRCLGSVNDFIIKILAERISRELDQDPTLLITTQTKLLKQRMVEKWKYKGYRTHDYFDI